MHPAFSVIINFVQHDSAILIFTKHHPMAAQVGLLLRTYINGWSSNLHAPVFT